MRSIFLVDDDDDDKVVFREALSKVENPVHLTAASNGKEALDILHAAVIKPDIIFSDINMPVMDGIQFIKAMKRDKGLNDIPAILLSTSISEIPNLKNRELEGIPCFMKPTCFNQLCEIIRSALRGVLISNISESSYKPELSI